MSEEAPNILIVYASQSGHARSLAEAVEQGAGSEGASVRSLHGTDASLDDLLWCRALVVVTPENFGYMAGAVKDFFDRTFYPAQGLVTNLPYAVVVRAGNDGSFALAAVERIARGYPFKRVAEPILWVGETEAPLPACHELGQTLAAGLSLGVFGGPVR
ncbi:MAG TPA: flavodoxin domain-containing protein [Polyangiales bacterium]